MYSMAFTALIFMKLRHVQQHYVEIGYAEFHQNGQEIRKVWVEVSLHP
jgi:hypothetical protein